MYLLTNKESVSRYPLKYPCPAYECKKAIDALDILSFMNSSSSETLIELNAKLERLINGIDTLHANQERMSEDISKIKEAVYNPDEGLYARLRNLEQWKESTSRVQWLVSSGVIMLMIKMVWDVMMAGGA